MSKTLKELINDKDMAEEEFLSDKVRKELDKEFNEAVKFIKKLEDTMSDQNSFAIHWAIDILATEFKNQIHEVTKCGDYRMTIINLILALPFDISEIKPVVDELYEANKDYNI